jgi:hypothetical protein
VDGAALHRQELALLRVCKQANRIEAEETEEVKSQKPAHNDKQLFSFGLKNQMYAKISIAPTSHIFHVCAATKLRVIDSFFLFLLSFVVGGPHHVCLALMKHFQGLGRKNQKLGKDRPKLESTEIVPLPPSSRT